jgi:hypothetical protein
MSSDEACSAKPNSSAFAALGDRLVRRGVVADLFMGGGAAMALAYDADRVTRELMPRSCRTASFWTRRAAWRKRWAYRRGWLNDQASAYVSNQYDAGKREVFDHPGIRVMAASWARIRDEGVCLPGSRRG